MTEPSISRDICLNDGTSLKSLVNTDTGRIARRIFSDPELFELEKAHIFRKAWCFLAHESEFSDVGDFVTRSLAGEPVVLIKDDQDQIRAFLNSCRHRGMRLCRTDDGNTSYLRCPYHGWSYGKDGTLVSVFAEGFYVEKFLKKDELGLIPVTKVETYKGLIFGTWDENAPSLSEFLGDMKFYIDMFVGRTNAGAEIVGTAQIWDSNANWKLLAENSCDNQHLHTAHGSVVQLGLLPPDPLMLAGGNLVDAGGGHILHLVPGPPDPFFEDLGLPFELRAEFPANLSEAQRSVAKRTSFSVGNVFPNLSFLHVMIQGDPETPPTPFLNFRVWEPLSATKTRIRSFVLVDRGASAEFRKRSFETYVRTFGPGGIFEQDDMENLEECTKVNSGLIAQRYPLHHAMSLHMEPVKDFPGPGNVWPTSFGETAQLAFYQHWQDCLLTGEQLELAA